MTYQVYGQDDPSYYVMGAPDTSEISNPLQYYSHQYPVVDNLGAYSSLSQGSTTGFVGDVAWLAIVSFAIYGAIKLFGPSVKPASEKIKRFVEK